MLEGRRVAQVVVNGNGNAYLATTAVHGAFHVFEAASRRDGAKFGAGENAMLVSTYPMVDVANEAAFALEGRILAATLTTRSVERTRELAREFVAVRRDRHRRLAPEFVTFDEMSELNEGLAEYALPGVKLVLAADSLPGDDSAHASMTRKEGMTAALLLKPRSGSRRRRNGTSRTADQ